MKPVSVGWKSPKWGDRGVYFLCTGPDPSGPMPGERLRVVIYDAAGNVTRRLEQIAGRVTEDGYVDFFNTARSRPTRQEMPIVDIAPDGAEAVLLEDYKPAMGREVLSAVFARWVNRYGRAA